MEAAGRTKNLGNLDGKLLVFGGVYGNLQALQAMRQVATEQGIPHTRILCTGDVAGYCAQPAECIALIREWGIHCIAGNIEIQLRDGGEDCGCNFNADGRCELFSRAWFAYAREKTGGAEIAWMKTLPDCIRFTYSGRQCAVLHGSAFETAGYIFASTGWTEKGKNFDEMGADIIIAGHSGLPFFQEAEGRCWLNAGVIGMPANDGDAHVWYAIIETGDSGNVKLSLCELAYDFETAARLMLAAGLPRQYALTLTTGLWDNCEILPQPETLAQGIRLAPTVYEIPRR